MSFLIRVMRRRMVSRPVSGVLSTFFRRMGGHPSQRSTSGVPLLRRRAGRLPCLILLRVGFTEPPVITHDAGALLPHRFTLTCTRLPEPSAVCSLWHFPARHRDSHFVSTLPCGAPTFLTARCRAVRPPSRLTIRVNSDTARAATTRRQSCYDRTVTSPRGDGRRVDRRSPRSRRSSTNS